MPTGPGKVDVMAPIKGASPEVQAVIKQVLALEHDNIWNAKPRLVEDIVRIIKDTVGVPEGDGE